MDTSRIVRTPLPIDGYLDRIVELARTDRAVVVTAAPGAGKTTRVPPALAVDGAVLLLQPRRVAARAMACRIAEEQGWTLGREVGWHVRFDRRSSPETRVLVVTEGILTARLQQDPLLSDVRTVILDEFHERSIHADLGLALVRQAWLARSDLSIVVMSATLDAGRVSAFLGSCPVVEVPGRTFPLSVSYLPGKTVEDVVGSREFLDRLRRQSSGASVLCFLPGTAEIRRTAERLAPAAAAAGVPVVHLYGALDADEQDAALRPSGAARIILATNIAETTLTVPDVAWVVDTGLHKLARYDAARAIDGLDLERVSEDSADQRAGRAGRTQAGTVFRLWDQRDRLKAHREPEIARVDLAGPVLDVLGWGGDPYTLEWFEAPPRDALDAAVGLLRRLGALDATGRLTAVGHRIRHLPLHPRLARLLLAARGAPVAARACALLSERSAMSPSRQATTSDLLVAAERSDLPRHVIQTATHLRAAAIRVIGDATLDHLPEPEFLRAVLAGYPDRVARRREPHGDRLVLSSGRGARLAKESGVHQAEFLVAVELTASSQSTSGDALVRIASGIEREWLTPTSTEMAHSFDADKGGVRAAEIDCYDEMTISERPCAPDPSRAAPLVAEAYVRRGPTEDDMELLRRLDFAGAPIAFDELVRAASLGTTRLAEIDLERHVPADTRRVMEREAPRTISLATGRSLRLNYRAAGVFASVKLQEVFGLKETPRLGRRRVPVTFELLAPSGRPVQITSDLGSFWARGYPEVRKELRARYPKHRWPESPNG